MKYTSVNELGTFDFHDASFENVTFENGNMVWYLHDLNATTENSQNKYPEDMCIRVAKLTFRHFYPTKIISLGYEIHYKDPDTIKSFPPVEHDKEYFIPFLQDAINGGFIQYINEFTSDSAAFCVDNLKDICEIYFKCNDCTVEWEEFDGSAWYEEPFEKH